MYESGYWLPAADAERIANMGLTYLECYEKAAIICHKRNRNRLPLHPKIHMMHHAFMQMLLQSQISDWVVNVMAETTQMGEDFIGKPSKLSRQVCMSEHQALRVMQRYLVAVRLALEDISGESLLGATLCDARSKGLAE